MISLALVLTIGTGAMLAGFVTGLAGFGTGLVALGFWLHVIDPGLAAPLVVICSVIAHTQSLFRVRSGIVWARIWPFLVGGCVGVPLGVLLLGHLDPETFRAAVGVFLLAYASYGLWVRRPPVLRAGRLADATVGFGGGVLGGAAGLSGPLPTIWCGLKGWTKDEQRGVFQAFNFTILGLALVSHLVEGIVTAQVLGLSLICLPAVVIGAWAGANSYDRIDDRQFRLIVLWLLMASGAVLTFTNLF